MTAPTTRETADHIGEANEKVADHIGATTMIDHAELGRKFEALAVEASAARNLDGAESMMVSIQTIYDFITSRNALLSEIAALRGERRNIVSHATMGATDGEGLSCNDASVAITRLRNEMHARLTQAERQRDEEIAVHTRIAAEVIEARRQRDELRKALETIGEMAPSTCETSLAHDMAQFANQALANQGPDQ